MPEESPTLVPSYEALAQRTRDESGSLSENLKTDYYGSPLRTSVELLVDLLGDRHAEANEIDLARDVSELPDLMPHVTIPQYVDIRRNYLGAQSKYQASDDEIRQAIFINERLFDEESPMRMGETIAHELVHAYEKHSERDYFGNQDEYERHAEMLGIIATGLQQNYGQYSEAELDDLLHYQTFTRRMLDELSAERMAR